VDAQASTPAEALELLLQGNARFVSGTREHPHQDADRRALLGAVQRPFATLFGCSDSRLAAEIIFDRGLGDLFVVRTAGHVVGPEVLGSIEYGVAVLDTPLIAVLGHDSCGAIRATLDAMGDGAMPEGYMRDIVERVMVGISSGGEPVRDPGEAVAEHVRHTVDMVAARSSVIADRLTDGRLGIIGMTYRLDEGSVHCVAERGVRPAA